MGNFEAVEWAFLARTRNPNKKAEILKFKDYTFLSHVISNSDMQDITKYFELVDKLNQNSNSSKKQDQNKKPLLDLTDVFTKISFVCLTKLSSSQDYCDKFEWFIVNAEKNKADLKTALLKTDNGSLLQNYIRNKHYSCLNLIFDKFPEIKEEVSKLPNYKTDIEPFLNIPKPIEVPVAEADDLTKSFRGLTESLEQNKDSSRCLVM
ncbi:MAG: hypothetical protein BGO27_06085 [Alphaproteobacteria bacterium 33-17]|nr:MAG: hypothetical protein BGO27_06085 [Alphaproteobacteria bacterium 33-17]